MSWWHMEGGGAWLHWLLKLSTRCEWVVRIQAFDISLQEKSPRYLLIGRLNRCQNKAYSPDLVIIEYIQL